MKERALNQRLQKMDDLVQAYEANIPLARRWLGSRGLTLADVAPYRLGVVVDDSPESRPYRRRLAIPYLTPAGATDIRFRSLDDGAGGPKYLSRPGAKGHLYNVAALWRDADVIAICEGEIDALVMDAFSGIPAVGVPGVKAWKGHYARLFVDYERVLVIGDGDEAGRDFTATLAGIMDNAIAVQIAPGMDISDLYATQGAGALGHLVAA